MLNPDREAKNAYQREWRKQNKDKYLEYREKEKSNPNYKNWGRKSKLKNNFNLTLEQYDEMFEEQNGMCACCNTHQSSLSISLAVDHCHTTGKIRKLLCNRCNLLLGNADESVELLENIIKYINKHCSK